MMMNKKPKRVKKAPQIRVLILQWFKMQNMGDSFLSDHMCDYVQRHLRGGAERDTIKRYQRDLRKEGQLNYNTPDKKIRIMTVIAPGEPHSR